MFGVDTVPAICALPPAMTLGVAVEAASEIVSAEAGGEAPGKPAVVAQKKVAKNGILRIRIMPDLHKESVALPAADEARPHKNLGDIPFQTDCA